MKRIGWLAITAAVYSLLLSACAAARPPATEGDKPAPDTFAAVAENKPDVPVREEVLVQTPAEAMPSNTQPAVVPEEKTPPAPVKTGTSAPAKTETTTPSNPAPEAPVQAVPLQETATPDPIPAEQPAASEPTVTQQPTAQDKVDAVSSATERGNYKNGLFSQQSPPNSDGYYLLAMMRVENGNIVSVSLQLFDKAGKLVNNAYAEGLGANAEEMKENLAALETYARGVIDAQNSSDVRETPGTAWSYDLFLNAVPELLRQAR